MVGELAMNPKSLLSLVGVIFITGCAVITSPPSGLTAQLQVFEAEKAFAATMRDRDLAAFGNFIDQEAIFFTGPEPLRGKSEVLAWWARYFIDPSAPFSWEPDQVEVLESGNLALSTGPIYSPDGVRIARFNSIWRCVEPGVWTVVFDKGSPLESKAGE
jgi:ketosteroid isomerase-like protein